MTESIREKVYGALFGYAIGDAIGLGTEFMSRQEVEHFYPEGLTDYSQFIRDAHRSQWMKGEYSTDTKIVATQLESLIENKGIDYLDVARRLKDLYNSDNVDLTPNLRWVLSQEEYEKDPFGTAIRVWDNMKRYEASNEVLGRAFFVGIWNENLPETAVNFCRLTHVQSRCEAASAIIAEMTADLMWTGQPSTYEKIIDIARKMNPDLVRYVDTAWHGTLEDFHLDDPDSLWFVRKAMGCALWAVWHCSSPDEALFKIINQGGDADTNGALAYGLLGIKYGYDALNKKLIEGLRNRDVIESLASRLTDLLEECRK